MNLAKCMVPVWFLRALHVQSNSQNCEHLKLCLECLLCCRYNQSWVRSLTTENKETRTISIVHETNLFYFKRSQNKSSILVIQYVVS